MLDALGLLIWLCILVALIALATLHPIVGTVLLIFWFMFM